jgi:SAM-dependent methyltransferase
MTSETLDTLAREFPPDLVTEQLADARRTAFHLSLVTERASEGATVVDVGGGVGLFSVALATAGFRSVLVDDFQDQVNERFSAPLAVHDAHGVTVIATDIVGNPGLDIEDASVSVVTIFDSIEHWHGSPKGPLEEALRILEPGGHLIVGVPNCVNLRKRITVPLGRGKWSSFDDWYEHPSFRGHVRECDTDDLRRISQDLGLVNVDVFGMNWQGYASSRRWVQRIVRLVDRPLRRFPSFCADLYLAGQKPVVV